MLENPGEYAYLIESSGADWAMTQYCDLQAIGGDINLRNYGIAMKLGEFMEIGESIAKRWKQDFQNFHSRIRQQHITITYISASLVP